MDNEPKHTGMTLKARIYTDRCNCPACQLDRDVAAATERFQAAAVKANWDQDVALREGTGVLLHQAAMNAVAMSLRGDTPASDFLMNIMDLQKLLHEECIEVAEETAPELLAIVAPGGSC